MSLHKIGSMLKILKTAASVEELVIDKPLTEKIPSTKILEKKHPEFLYFRARAISALETSGPNGNGDGFPKKELEASYETFQNKNLFLNHESDSPIKSIGRLVDSYLIEDPDTKEVYVECLAKIDLKLHPEIGRKISTGELNTVSMGCSCDASECSICGKILHADSDEKCEHLSRGLLKEYIAEIDRPEYGIKKGDMAKAYCINSGIVFNELSIVNIPADGSAIIKTIISNLKDRLSKKASLTKEEQLDLIGQMDNLFSKLDEATKEQVKAEFCGCPLGKEAGDIALQRPCESCGVKEAKDYIGKSDEMSHALCEKCRPKFDMKEASKESTMAEQDEYKQILSKMSAYEFEKLEGYISHKQKKSCAEKAAPIVAKAEEKQESFLQKIIEKAKETVAGKIFSNTVKRLAENELKPKVETEAKVELKVHKCPECGKRYSCKDESSCDKEKDSVCSTCAKVETEAKVESKKDAEKCVMCKKNPAKKDGYCSKECEDKAVAYALKHMSFGSLRAEFKKDTSDILKSIWSVYDGDKLVLDASLKEIWGDKIEDEAWATSAEYGQAIIARYQDKQLGGVEKLAALWDVAYKLTDVKNSKVEEPAKADFVKPEEKTKADKEHEKSSESVETKYEVKEEEVKKEAAEGKTEEVKVEAAKMSEEAQKFIKKHIKKHKTEDKMEQEQAVRVAYEEARKKGYDVPAAPKSASVEFETLIKEADAYVEDPILEVKPEETLKTEDLPKEDEVKPAEEPKPELLPEVKPEEAPVSAFDKLDDKIDVGEGYEAIKDKETKEIVISKDGQEIKRLPDGFGDDVPTVLKLLRAVLGLPELGEEKKEPMPEVKPEEAPKVEEPKLEEPKVEEPVVDEFAQRESALKAKEDELNKRAEEIKQKEAAVVAQKFSSLVNARSERCRRIVEGMFEKELLSYDEQTFDSELESGRAVLDARKLATEAVANKKVRELLAMTDEVLSSTEKTVEETKIPSATKKASRIPNLSYRTEIGAEEEISAIFRSMGTLKGSK